MTVLVDNPAVVDGSAAHDNHHTTVLPSCSLYSMRAVVAVFLVPACGALLFGYDIGGTSYVLSSLVREGSRSPSDYSTTPIVPSWAAIVAVSAVWQGALVCASSLGALCASVAIFSFPHFLVETLGRKRELQVSALLYLIGGAAESWASVYETTTTDLAASPSHTGLLLLLAGRLVFGLGIGFTMHAGPTYLGEMAPPSIRGTLVSLKEASIVTGVLLGYSVGYWRCHHPDDGDDDAAMDMPQQHHSGIPEWALIYNLTMVMAVIMGAVSFTIPPSSRWLMSRGRDREALASVRFVYDQDDGTTAQREFQALVATAARRNSGGKHKHNSERSDGTFSVATDVESTTSSSSSAGYDEAEDDDASSTTMSSSASSPNVTNHNDVVSLWHPDYHAPLLAGVGLVVLQQVTGQPSVLSYATRIFEEAGISSYSSILVAVWKLVATVSAASVVEKFGRTRLLYTGCSLMLGALVVLALFFDGPSTTSDEQDATALPWRKAVVVAAMFVYIGGYQVGFGPISWLIMSEIFPAKVRGQAVAFSIQMNFLLNTVVQFCVPVLEYEIGLAKTFGIFAVLSAYSIYFIKAHVPETKGLTLEEIEEKFRLMRLANKPVNEELPLLGKGAAHQVLYV